MHLEPRLLARSSAFVHDLLWIPVALFVAFLVPLERELFQPGPLQALLVILLIGMPIQGASFVLFGLYRGIWRFASLPDLIRILRAVWVGALLTIGLFSLLRVGHATAGTLFLYPVFLTIGLTAPRFIYRWYKNRLAPLGTHRRALVVGAGLSGEQLIRELSNSRDYIPVGVIDVDRRNIGRDLHGVRVAGTVDELEYVLRSLEVGIVLIAMPTATPAQMRKIVDTAAHVGVPCVTLPSLQELTDGSVEVSRLREVEIQDLLGRDVITIDDAGLKAFLAGKCVLVTGAGGSIGSELCRQVVRYGPAELILFDHSEYGLYRTEQEVRALKSGVRMTALLGDVVDEARMRHVFSTHEPQIVLHAAAYKHVPLVEDNVVEGVRTNSLGTRVVADLAVASGCEKFVLVSTDKAVLPTNVMGASKRIAELYCQRLSQNGSGTAFIVTRFGNVMGSAGSVVPLFRRQIAAGGPVTVTHPEITRYFMTIPEAVSLILQAAAMGEGGEIFVLDMGKPIRIRDLAEEMIRLSGHEPERDIPIVYVGLRQGEKLHEDLFYSFESPVGTIHPKILQARPRREESELVDTRMALLQRACEGQNETMVKALLREKVPDCCMHPAAAVDTQPAAANLKLVEKSLRAG